MLDTGTMDHAEQGESIYDRRIREMDAVIKEAQQVLQRAAEVKAARPPTPYATPAQLEEARVEAQRQFDADMREVEQEVAARGHLLAQLGDSSRHHEVVKRRKMRNLI